MGELSDSSFERLGPLEKQLYLNTMTTEDMLGMQQHEEPIIKHIVHETPPKVKPTIHESTHVMPQMYTDTPLTKKETSKAPVQVHVEITLFSKDAMIIILLFILIIVVSCVIAYLIKINRIVTST
jgi:hypothetical protein